LHSCEGAADVLISVAANTAVTITPPPLPYHPLIVYLGKKNYFEIKTKSLIVSLQPTLMSYSNKTGHVLRVCF
jgi:hypothetical protein